jgi:hypothetical protein
MTEPKRFLPSLGVRPLSSAPPTVDEARAALGGRRAASAGRLEGRGVAFLDARGRTVRGVVVCATDAEVDVWVGDGRFQRLAATRAEPMPVPPDDTLAEIVADARVFSRLQEGERVRFLRRDGRLDEGRLVEKCRYGALVAHDDRVIAVSFRRIWPLCDGIARST